MRATSIRPVGCLGLLAGVEHKAAAGEQVVDVAKGHEGVVMKTVRLRPYQDDAKRGHAGRRGAKAASWEAESPTGSGPAGFNRRARPSCRVGGRLPASGRHAKSSASCCLSRA